MCTKPMTGSRMDARRTAGLRSFGLAPRSGALYQYFSGKEQLLAESDFVSVHPPLTADTRKMINDATLAKKRENKKALKARTAESRALEGRWQALVTTEVARLNEQGRNLPELGGNKQKFVK